MRKRLVAAVSTCLAGLMWFGPTAGAAELTMIRLQSTFRFPRWGIGRI